MAQWSCERLQNACSQPRHFFCRHDFPHHPGRKLNSWEDASFNALVSAFLGDSSSRLLGTRCLK